MERTREDLFGVLIREHELGLRAFVGACVHATADADDLVQDTFVAAWAKLEEYDRNRPFATWLRGIAQHKVLAYFRTSAADHRHARSLPPVAVSAIADEFERLNHPPRGEVYRDSFAALHECLKTLAQTDGEIVRRAYAESQTCRTIASQLGQSVEAVKKRLQRARAELRDCILTKLAREATDA